MRESHLVSIDINVGGTAGDVFYDLPVTPIYFEQSGGFTNMTHLTFGCLPFRYWRGTIRYRFEVVSSVYHKGSIRIFYNDEKPTTPTTADNSTYNVVLDLASANQCSMDVPYARDLPLLAMTSHNLADASVNNLLGHNGNLTVQLVSPLIAPVAGATVTLQVFVSAGDDFQLYERSGMERACYKVTPVAYSTGIVPGFSLDPFYTDAAAALTSLQVESGLISATLPPVTTTVTMEEGTPDAINLLHIGEMALSFRTLLKRYDLITAFDPTPGEHIALRLPNSPVYWDLRTTQKSFFRNNLLGYLSQAYRGYRGGLRFLSTQQAGSNQQSSVHIDTNLTNNSTFAPAIVDLGTGIAGAKLASKIRYALGGRGCQMYNGSEGICVEIPGTTAELYTSDDPGFTQCGFRPSPIFVTQYSTNHFVEMFYAIAEDFNFVDYVGPPLFALNSLNPEVPAATLS